MMCSWVKGITLMVSYIIRIAEIACSAGSGTKVIIEIETPTKVGYNGLTIKHKNQCNHKRYSMGKISTKEHY
jgi:hypothetical protein